MAIVAALVCLPLALCIFLDAGFLVLANEPLAYRFFYSERAFSGDFVVVGVGYLVSVLHHVVYFLMHLFPSVAGATLEARLNLFALITNGALSTAICAILYLAATSRILKAIDLVLLALVALMPIYGTVMSGYDYALMADYHFLNLVICVATLFIFQLLWRSQDPISLTTTALLGAFVGLAIANKITLLVLTAVILIPAISVFRSGRDFLLRCLVAGGGGIAAFLAAHLVSYLGSVRRMLAGLEVWWGFASNPGGEPAFWGHMLSGFIQGYNYGVFIAFSVVMLLLVLFVLFRKLGAKLPANLVVAFCAASFLSCMYFVAKRPAGSTLFEAAIFCFTLSTVLLTIAAEWRPMRYVIAGISLAWAAFAISTFDVRTTYNQIASSGSDSRAKWAAFGEVLQRAGPLPIEVIYPDNSFHHEGPFELLFKAATDFPTWDIRSGQKVVIERYAPGMSFRHDFGTLKPEMPYGSGRVLVWFDLTGQEPLLSKYSELSKAVSRIGVKREVVSHYSTAVTMNVAILPTSTASSRARP